MFIPRAVAVRRARVACRVAGGSVCECETPRTAARRGPLARRRRYLLYQSRRVRGITKDSSRTRAAAGRDLASYRGTRKTK